MTPERLAQLKQHILHPPSASLNREWMLELVEELESRFEAERILALPHDLAPGEAFKAAFAHEVASATPELHAKKKAHKK